MVNEKYICPRAEDCDSESCVHRDYHQFDQSTCHGASGHQGHVCSIIQTSCVMGDLEEAVYEKSKRAS